MNRITIAAIIGLCAWAPNNALAMSGTACHAPEAPTVDVETDVVTSASFYVAYRALRNYQNRSAIYRRCLKDEVMPAPERAALFTASLEEEEALVTRFGAVIAVFRSAEGHDVTGE